MKKFTSFIIALFICSIAFAQTINWYVDNQVYQTTTCENGSNVTPPTPPEKYGYHFIEWAIYSAQVEYLESTGTQWIDTGYVPSSSGYKAIGKMRFVGAQSRFASILGGDYASNATANKFGKYELSNNWAATLGCSSDSRSAATFDIGLDYNFEISFIVGNRYLKINNETVITSSCETFISTAGSVFLFTYNRTSTLSSESMKGRIYYVKIYDNNNTLVRDMIPVLDINNTPCMYDKVSNQLFYNAGTGEFITGPVVEE